jgi:hypothetical protein
MQARLKLLGLSALLVGCAADRTLPTDLTAQATPAQWTSAAALEVTVSDESGKALGSFKIALTREPASTCLGGAWLKATPIASDLVTPDLSAWWKDESLWPSYEIVGRRLDIELNGGGLCDAYVSVLAELHEVEGRGHLESSGLGGATRHGSVLVRIAPLSAPANTSLERMRER